MKVTTRVMLYIILILKLLRLFSEENSWSDKCFYWRKSNGQL